MPCCAILRVNTFSCTVSNFVYFSMTQSMCAKCKRFISRKCSYAFCGADNGLYPSDDCDPVVAAESGPSLPLLGADFSLDDCVSSPFLSSQPENDGMRCHSSRMSSDVSSALSAVKSSLSILTKFIFSLERRIARTKSGLSLLDRLELILETFNARMVEFNATAIQGC